MLRSEHSSYWQNPTKRKSKHERRTSLNALIMYVSVDRWRHQSNEWCFRSWWAEWFFRQHWISNLSIHNLFLSAMRMLRTVPTDSRHCAVFFTIRAKVNQTTLSKDRKSYNLIISDATPAPKMRPYGSMWRCINESEKSPVELTSGSKFATGRALRCINPCRYNERHRQSIEPLEKNTYCTVGWFQIPQSNGIIEWTRQEYVIDGWHWQGDHSRRRLSEIDLGQISYFFTWPGKYRMYLLSCKERKRMVSKRMKRTFFRVRKWTCPYHLPSTFVELWITVLGAWVKRIKSTPYFLLFNVFFALQRHNGKILSSKKYPKSFVDTYEPAWQS